MGAVLGVSPLTQVPHDRDKLFGQGGEQVRRRSPSVESVGAGVESDERARSRACVREPAAPLGDNLRAAARAGVSACA